VETGRYDNKAKGNTEIAIIPHATVQQAAQKSVLVATDVINIMIM